ncbi:MAG: sulfatase [Spirochaetes bacterium]|nr:sulfatase [Spirochaetota bacterium]
MTTRRDFLRQVFTVGAAVAAGGISSMAANKKQPNLLYVFPDEYRRQAIGFMNEDPVLTPNLDAFCRDSIVFTHAQSAIPICTPYRGMLFTGQYPYTNGLTGNCMSGKPDMYLRKEKRIISDILAESGYSCGYIGKWHLDAPHEPYINVKPGSKAIEWDEYTPLDERHGFSFWYSHGSFNQHMNMHYWTGNAARSEYHTVNEWSPTHEAKIACSYIRNDGGSYRDPSKPFALFVSMNPPHMPFEQVPEEYKKLYNGKTAAELLTRKNVDLSSEAKDAVTAKKSVHNYFACVSGVDDAFGSILSCLKAQGLDENTIVVFSSDHGEMMGSQNRMHKGYFYEESAGIPFIIRHPGVLKPRMDNLLLNVPDIMPTLLSLMGLRDRIPADIEGGDYASIFRDEGGVRPKASLFIGVAEKWPVRGIKTARHSFIVRNDNGVRKYELYDNESDKYQMKNIAGQDSPLEKELLSQLDDLLARTKDPKRAMFTGA